MADRHKDKDIQAAIEYALLHGWRLFVGGSHAWGFLYCPHEERDGCRVAIYSTPRDPFRHAREIRKHVDRCTHTGREQGLGPAGEIS